jgi:hypothetical protein
MEWFEVIFNENMLQNLKTSIRNVLVQLFFVPLPYVGDVWRRTQMSFPMHLVSLGRGDHDGGFSFGVFSNVGKQFIGIGEMFDNIGTYDEIERPFYLGILALNVVFNPFTYVVVRSAPANAVCLVDSGNLRTKRVHVLCQFHAVAAAHIKDALDRTLLGNPSGVLVNGDLENMGEFFAILMLMSRSVRLEIALITIFNKVVVHLMFVLFVWPACSGSSYYGRQTGGKKVLEIEGV